MQIESHDEAGTAMDRLRVFAGLLELALHAPESEVTFEGKEAMQVAAREVTLIADQIVEKSRPQQTVT